MCFKIPFSLSAIPQYVRNVPGAELIERLVPRFPRGPWTPKDVEVTLGVGRLWNHEGEEQHTPARGTRGVTITARGMDHSSVT